LFLLEYQVLPCRITLDPIQQTVEEQKRFVADASHELKTPITALQTSLEVNLNNKNLDKNIKQILRENLEEVENLSNLTKIFST
jgi:signal transduction histidine kinase